MHNRPKPLILIVEDNQQIRKEIQMMLEFNDYHPITADNGEEALNLLSKMENTPDLIISDIMMPKMNGYDFFKKVSTQLRWYDIPFIFLTARTAPEDIRFGKILGVDDYITKPFNDEDLLATLEGKLARSKTSHVLTNEIAQVLNLTHVQIDSGKNHENKGNIYLFVMIWDEMVGPRVLGNYPGVADIPFSLEEIAVQLFQTTVSIYGQMATGEPDGLLIKIKNLNNNSGYIYFDFYEDNNVRGNQRQYMLVTIAPKIGYLSSLQIKLVFKEFSEQIKSFKDWKINDYWKQVVQILLEPGIPKQQAIKYKT